MTFFSFKKLTGPEKLPVIIIIILGVLASLSQTLVYWWETPPGKIFLFAHNYLEDYYYYLHIMRQGLDGSWLATSRLTPDIFPGQFVVVFFLFLGHLSGILNISLPVMYTLARAFGAAALFYLVYLLIKRVYLTKEKRITALAVVIFGTFWWIPQNNIPQLPWLVRAWTELDPLFRGSYIPHHLWSKIFFLISLLILTSGKRLTPWRTAFLVSAVAAMGFASPVIIIIFVPLVTIWTIIEFMITSNTSFWLASQRARPESDPGQARMTALAMIAIAVLIAVYHRYIQYSVFPWTGSYIVWENSMRYPITLFSFLESLGPAFVFFLFGIPWLLKTSPLTRLLVVWVSVGFLLLYVAGKFIPLSNSRYLSGYYFIPIGIGAIGGIWEISKLFCKVFYRFRSSRLSRPEPGSLEQYVRSAIVIILFVYFAVGLLATWQLHLSYIRQNSENQQVYLSKEIYGAFRYLDMHSRPGEVVLARYPLSTMIPAFTSDRVVAGHALMSVDNDLRSGEIDKFYSYRLSSGNAGVWLSKYRTGIIIEDRRSDFTDNYYRSLPVLAIYEKGPVIVYAVKY